MFSIGNTSTQSPVSRKREKLTFLIDLCEVCKVFENREIEIIKGCCAKCVKFSDRFEGWNIKMVQQRLQLIQLAFVAEIC